jgi:hypothetical protein
VGPGEAYPTIQAAIDAALARRGRHDIHVRAGEFRERLVIRPGARDELVISGGWGPGFVPEERVPRATVVDGAGVAPVVRVDATAGSVRITGFTITGGSSGRGNEGGGLDLFLIGSARAEVVDNLIHENHLVAGGALAGGLRAWVREGATFALRGNDFERNSATTTSTELGAGSGGASVSGQGRARLDVSDNSFVENSIAGTFGSTSALSVTVGNAAVADVNGNTFRENRSTIPTDRQSAVRLSATHPDPGEVPTLVARRNTVVFNHFDSDAPDSSQVLLYTEESSRLQFTDSLVALGHRRGVTVAVGKGGSPQLTNLTVVRQSQEGVVLEPASGAGGTPLLANTILWLNAVDVSGDFLQLTNLTGVDPYFRDWPGQDYRITEGSPARDAGTDAPPGGLGPWDLDGHIRRQGSAVDIGAYEVVVPSPPPSDDGVCRVLWGVDRATHVCRCFMDRDLPYFNCGLLGPEVFLDLRVPWPPTFGKEMKVDWTIHPWASLAGPYEMEMAVRVGKEWSSQKWLGPTAKGLEDGKLVVEPFVLKLAEPGRTLLRTTVKYLRLGDKEPTVGQVDVLLPDPDGKGRK